MTQSLMRRYLHKPTPAQTPTVTKWSSLYRLAVARAEAVGDVRVRDLLHYAGEPERACRRLSILTEADIEREFPRK